MAEQGGFEILRWVEIYNSDAPDEETEDETREGIPLSLWRRLQ
jgi:hypothetical protein